jgi:hypothetical protein
VEIQSFVWYPTSFLAYGPINTYRLIGRTSGRFVEDNTGPAFDSLEDLQRYIKENNLVMCGTEK